MKLGWFSSPNLSNCGENAFPRFQSIMAEQVSISGINSLLMTGTFSGNPDYFMRHYEKLIVPNLLNEIPLYLTGSPYDFTGNTIEGIPIVCKDRQKYLDAYARKLRNRHLLPGVQSEPASLGEGVVFLPTWGFPDYEKNKDNTNVYIPEWDAFYDFAYCPGAKARWDATPRIAATLHDDFRRRLKIAVSMNPRVLLISVNMAVFKRMFTVDSVKFIRTGNQGEHWAATSPVTGEIIAEAANENEKVKFVVLCDNGGRQYNIIKERNVTAILANAYTRSNKGHVVPAFHQLEV